MGRVEHFEGAVRAVRGMGRALLYGERLGYAEPGRAVWLNRACRHGAFPDFISAETGEKIS